VVLQRDLSRLVVALVLTIIGGVSRTTVGEVVFWLAALWMWIQVEIASHHAREWARWMELHPEEKELYDGHH
jgi:hypothetical protein